MKITHHLDDATIMAFAAGTIGEAHGVVASTHLAYCRTCRDAVRLAEKLGGCVLAAQDGEAVTQSCRSATLASLDGVGLASATPKPRLGSYGIPLVLNRLVGNQPLESLTWKSKAPGVSMVDIALPSGARGRLQLLRIGPGRQMPEHGHGGEELTVVLKGSYCDHIGHFGPGDAADLDPEVEHQPIVDSDVDCICLVATEAPTRFKSWWAKLAQPFIGI